MPTVTGASGAKPAPEKVMVWPGPIDAGRPCSIPFASGTNAGNDTTGAAMTSTVSVCAGPVPAPFCPVTVTSKLVPTGSLVAPASVAVPSPLSTKLTPPGSTPDTDRLTAPGCPLPADTVKEPSTPWMNSARSALVMTGGPVTVSRNAWVTSAVRPLDAVTVSG